MVDVGKYTSHMMSHGCYGIWNTSNMVEFVAFTHIFTKSIETIHEHSKLVNDDLYIYILFIHIIHTINRH